MEVAQNGQNRNKHNTYGFDSFSCLQISRVKLISPSISTSEMSLVPLSKVAVVALPSSPTPLSPSKLPDFLRSTPQWVDVPFKTPSLSSYEQEIMSGREAHPCSNGMDWNLRQKKSVMEQNLIISLPHKKTYQVTKLGSFTRRRSSKTSATAWLYSAVKQEGKFCFNNISK